MKDQDDDGIMLNIKHSTAPKINSSGFISKSKIKKEKYTMKFKKQRSKNMSNRSSSFEYNLLPKEQDLKQKEQVKDIDGQQFKIQSIHKNQNQQTNNRQYKKDYPEKQSSRNKYRNRQYQQRNIPKVIGKIDTSKAHIQMPEEIKPEKVQPENKIDKNSLSFIHELIKDSLLKNDINNLTDIQNNCFKPISLGKDVIAKASTGSGKTLAYLIPIIHRLIETKGITGRDSGTVILIICPSRELCVQGQKEALRCLKRLPFIVPGSLIGGEQTNHEKNRLRKGVGILFSTPGRLLYHLKNTKAFKLDNIKTIVFEEADRTLDMGFQQNIEQILKIINDKVQMTYTQKILVSAHFNQKVESLIKNLNVDNPSYIGFDRVKNENDIKEENLQDDKPTLMVQQINISQNLKQQYVLMTEEERIPLMIAYLKCIKGSKVMIFVNTIDEVEYLDYLINNMCYRDCNGDFTTQKIQTRTVYKIHGDLDQKLRSNTYFSFRKEQSAILISTEVASRGLDFPDLNHIILFDVPPTITDYGNRVGRSARFNSSGVSLLMLHYQESDYAQKIRYYSPKLQMLDKDIILEGFQSYLAKINIRQKGLYYLEGIVRGMVKDDDQKYQLAKRAYTSMLRAYAKLKDKHTFAIKKLDLKLLGRCFGINSTGGRQKQFNPKAKESHFEAVRKKRKVESVKKLQISQYL